MGAVKNHFHDEIADRGKSASDFMDLAELEAFVLANLSHPTPRAVIEAIHTLAAAQREGLLR